MQTIVAIATPIGKGGVGIVRLSGENAFDIAKKLTSAFPNIPNMMTFGEIYAEGFSDTGYVVKFISPKSFTGEDVVEFHLHGSPRILSGVVDQCIKFGARLAEKGEFTKRAFLNGKLKLSDAEGVIDMINAESASAVRLAHRLITGKFSTLITGFEKRLLAAMAMLEASLDYPDEMEDDFVPMTVKEVGRLNQDIKELIETQSQGKMAKFGIDVAIIGETNAGKSSLMNALLNRERAIVTNTPGTTRDVISESFEYSGVKINLVDTAGLRNSDDEIEKIGQKMSVEEAKKADVILLVMAPPYTTIGNVPQEIYDDLRTIKVFNKCDTLTAEQASNVLTMTQIGNKVVKTDNKHDFSDKNKVMISAKTGNGLNDLLERIITFAGVGEESELVASKRHLSCLVQAQKSLADALDSFYDTPDVLLIDLRNAYEELGKITGNTVTDDIVDEIFSTFCVGK